VAANTRSAPDQTEQHAQVYVAFTQRPNDDIYLAVRPTSGRAEALTPSIRAAIGRVDREQLVGTRDVMTLEAIGRDATAQYRFRATLVLAFAALALSLAMVGLFGVLAYTVQRRWRDYGVRLALGAKTGDVLSLITRNAARLIAPGALVGTALALAAGPLLGATLFGVRPFDLTTLVVVLSVLALTAAASIAGPALRATRVDPANALRNE
jgi:putative ABC transport system permease protein